MSERPSHIPPENPFGSQEGKLPPEPTAKFVERYLGKRRGDDGAVKPAAPEPTDLATPEERATREEEGRAEYADFGELYDAEIEKLSELLGHEVEVPLLPPEVTPERVEAWREQGFALHYLPRVELTGKESGLKVPLKFSLINKDKVDSFGPDRLKPLELPGAWVLIDTRPKPAYTDGTQQYPNDAQIERALGGLRFSMSWTKLHEPITVSKLADVLKVDPSQIRLPRAVEFNVLGNLHHPEWGTTNTSEWFEDSYDNGRVRLTGGYSGSGGLANVDSLPPDNAGDGYGFRPLVIIK